MKNFKKMWMYCFVILLSQTSLAKIESNFCLKNNLEKIEIDTIVPSVIQIEEDDNTDNSDKEEPLFKVVEEMPRFPGCEDLGITNKNELKKCAEEQMLKFIYGSIQYPAEARKNGTEGKVILQYIIEKDGSVGNVRLLRGPGDGCGEEAVRVVKTMPNWIPGKQRGQAQRVQYTLPVRFKVENKTRARIPNNRKFSNSRLSKSKIGTPNKGKSELKEVDEMPRFPGCEDNEITDQNELKKCAEEKMLYYIYSNLNKPRAVRKGKVEGKVIIQFLVTEDGSIKNVRVLRDRLGYGCGAEARRVIKSMPKWIPGKINGEPAEIKYTMPVRFNNKENY